MAGRPPRARASSPPPRGSAYTAALRLLGRRDYSTVEITARLTDRGYAAADVQAAVERLLDNGSIDDRRVALVHVRTASRVKGRGRRRIQQELEVRGISRTLISEVMAQLSPDDDERAINRFLARRHVPAALTPDARRRVFQQLLRRGFAADVIARALRRPGDRRDD